MPAFPLPHFVASGSFSLALPRLASPRLAIRNTVPCRTIPFPIHISSPPASSPISPTLQLNRQLPVHPSHSPVPSFPSPPSHFFPFIHSARRSTAPSLPLIHTIPLPHRFLPQTPVSLLQPIRPSHDSDPLPIRSFPSCLAHSLVTTVNTHVRHIQTGCEPHPVSTVPFPQIIFRSRRRRRRRHPEAVGHLHLKVCRMYHTSDFFRLSTFSGPTLLHNICEMRSFP
ncbi:hypothetical protein CGRA01v4_04109 [Colletotrichum graminicola]|nr:hypothetical protein CGRA01v4_04109 [Colletotrichum graminicola]